MKRKLLLLTALVVSALTGMRAQTWTASNLSEDGWTKISSISKEEIANNYYIFLSEDESLILRLEQSTSQASYAAFYRSLSNPALDGFKVWTLEANGDNYAMRNLEWNSRQMQTEWSGNSNDLRWRTNDQMNSISWTGLGLTNADGAWTLTSTQYGRPLGIYNNTEGTPSDGKEIGANDSGKGQKFQIYAISRTAYWELAAADASAKNPVDFTGFIKNAEIYNNNKGVIPSGWSEDTSIRQAGNSNRTAGTGITELEGWSGATLKVKYYQDLTGLPLGNYKLQATGGDSNGTGGGKIFINGGDEDVTSALGSTAEVSTDPVLTTDGNITIGLTAEGEKSWVHANNFKLYYLGIDLSDYITAYQTALTNAKAAAATTDKMATAVLSALNNAIETYDEGKVSETKAALETAIETLNTATNKANESIESYKVVEAQTIPSNTLERWTISNNSTFHVNTWSNEGATDGSNFGTPFIENWRAGNDNKPLEDATITYTLPGLNPGVYKVSMRVRTLNEYDSSADITGAYLWAVGASDVNAVEKSDACTNGLVGNYSINAIVGDDGILTFGLKNVSATYNWISFKNVEVKDLSDLVSASESLLNSVPEGKMNAEVQNNLNIAVQNLQSDKNNINYYDALSDAVVAANLSIEAYSKFNQNLNLVAEGLIGTNIYSESVYEELYLSPKTAYDNATYLDIDANKYTSGSRTEGNLPAILLSTWKKGETSAIEDGGLYINTWSVEGNNDGSNFKTPFYEYWVGDDNVLAATTLTAVQTGLEADKDYKVSIWARVRQTNNATKATSGITMKVGDGDAIDISAGTQIGTSPLYIGEYAAVGKTDADGKLTVTITVNEESNISWLAFKNVKYSQVTLATDEQKEALANAIIAAEGHKLGFDKDEFAPYSNVEVLEALDKAKNINVDVEDASVLDQATNQLNDATWVANIEEVNAFFDGSFASQAPKNDGNSGTKVKGWTNNVSIRTLVKSENEAEAIYKATDGHAGMYVWSGAAATYGETAGYTMPLNAHTIYKFGYKRGSWNGDNSSSYAEFVVKDPSGNIVCKLGNNEGARNYLSTEGELISYDGYFVTGEKGDYTVTINNSGNSVLTGLYLYTVEGNVLTFTDGQAVPNYAPGTYPNVKVDRKLTTGRWVTAVYPFAISGVEDLTIANATSVEEGVVKFTHVDASEANKPFFMISEEGKTNIQLENVAVAAAASANFEGEGVTTVGSYAMKTILDVEEGKTKYVLQSNKLNYVGANVTWVDTYRAYLVVPTSATGEVKQLSIAFDGDEATGISGFAVEKQFDGTIYDLSGRVVKNPSRGLYIINGKKVMVR